MAAYKRWIVFLLGWHLLALIASMIYDCKTGSPVWARIICALAIGMLPYSWGFTVAMLLGAKRTRRKWYCITLLPVFIYYKYKILHFIWIIGLVLGGKPLAAGAVGGACLGLLIHSVSGILKGN